MPPLNFKDKKIIILGFAVEGINTYQYLRELYPDQTIAAADIKTEAELPPATKKLISRDKKLTLHLGPDYLSGLKDYDLIIKTPGIPLSIKELQEAKKQGKTITSQTKIFFSRQPGTIIGITGTKGKTTTSTLIHHVLKSAQLDVHLIGNVGNPPLQLLKTASKDTIFVYELSSYQLDSLNYSPHIAVLLNLYPEHLNYHGTLAEYGQAKANITLHQKSSDLLIYNSQERNLEKLAEQSPAQKLPFGLGNTNNNICFLEQNHLVYISKGKKEIVIKKDSIPLLGQFNLQNIMPAIIIGKHYGLTNKQIAKAISSFKPVKYRLEPIGTYRSITFFNDSIATIPQATMQAMDTLGPDLHTLIAGGFDRGLNFDQLGRKIINSPIKTLILFPDTGAKIKAAVLKAKPQKDSIKILPAKAMSEAVKLAYKHTPKGKICLLSPGSPSFTLFKNYIDEGDQYKKWVKKLGGKADLSEDTLSS